MLYLWNSVDYNSQPAIPLEPEPSNFLISQFTHLNSCAIRGWPTPYGIFGLFSNPNIIVPEAWTLAMQYQTGIVASTTPFVETAVCLGWLLFLAPEYDLEELQQAILLATGVKVALHYCIIQDSLLVQAPCQTPWIKAIHIEVDIRHQRTTPNGFIMYVQPKQRSSLQVPKCILSPRFPI